MGRQRERERENLSSSSSLFLSFSLSLSLSLSQIQFFFLVCALPPSLLPSLPPQILEGVGGAGGTHGQLSPLEKPWDPPPFGKDNGRSSIDNLQEEVE